MRSVLAHCSAGALCCWRGAFSVHERDRDFHPMCGSCLRIQSQRHAQQTGVPEQLTGLGYLDSPTVHLHVRGALRIAFVSPNGKINPQQASQPAARRVGS